MNFKLDVATNFLLSWHLVLGLLFLREAAANGYIHTQFTVL